MRKTLTGLSVFDPLKTFMCIKGPPEARVISITLFFIDNMQVYTRAMISDGTDIFIHCCNNDVGDSNLFLLHILEVAAINKKF